MLGVTDRATPSAMASVRCCAPRRARRRRTPPKAAAHGRPKAEAARDRRKALSDKVSNAIKTYRRGLVTQDKLANPDAYKTDSAAKGPKAATEILAQHIANAIKTLQGDKAFPDDFAQTDAVAQLLAFQRAHKLGN